MKWFCESISSIFTNIKSKSESSITGNIPLRSSLVYPSMKSRSNHKLNGAHPLLAHRIIRKHLDLLCCLHSHCLLWRRNYLPDVLSFSTRFHFWSWKIVLRPEALLDIFLAGRNVLKYPWIFSHLFFYTQCIYQIYVFSEMLWTL